MKKKGRMIWLIIEKKYPNGVTVIFNNPNSRDVLESALRKEFIEICANKIHKILLAKANNETITQKQLDL